MANPLTVGGLFSGIGGWELGLERAGMEIAWHCESDPFCRKVLAKHWPDVPCYEDVCGLTGADVSPVDVLCGGFPCQGLSNAGMRLGLLDPRSGLWSEYARLIGELRPRYVLVENVSALLVRGLERVLGDLAALGFDAEWECVPASAIGAPHRRDRLWIVAYPSGEGLERRIFPEASRETLAKSVAMASRQGPNWTVRPSVSGVGYGLSDWLDRIRSLGNALVPQIAQWIGERIVSYEASLDGVYEASR